MDRQEMLADDVQLRMRQQVMDIGDASGDRVLDRDHAELGFALLDRRECVLEGRARQRLAGGIDLARRDVGIGAGLALERDFQLFHAKFRSVRLVTGSTAREQCARLFEVLGRVDAEDQVVGERHVDPHAGFERAELLEPLARLERRGRQRDEALERAAPVGVEADVVIERALDRSARSRG